MDTHGIASYAQALLRIAPCPLFLDPMSHLFSWRPAALCVLASSFCVASLAAPIRPPSGAEMNDLNDPLRDTRWQLQTVDGAAVRQEQAAQAPWLILSSQNHQMRGSTGCNRLTGRHTQRGTRLSLQAGATRMACPAPQMQTEQVLLQALAATDGYRVEGRTLSLLQGESVRATFISARDARRR